MAAFSLLLDLLVAIRAHWRIETTSHDSRDVTFGEGRSRIRTNLGLVENLSRRNKARALPPSSHWDKLGPASPDPRFGRVSKGIAFGGGPMGLGGRSPWSDNYHAAFIYQHILRHARALAQFRFQHPHRPPRQHPCQDRHRAALAGNDNLLPCSRDPRALNSPDTTLHEAMPGPLGSIPLSGDRFHIQIVALQQGMRACAARQYVPLLFLRRRAAQIFCHLGAKFA